MPVSKKVEAQAVTVGTREPRILLWDIETAPLKVYTWGIWEQNAIWIAEQWHILTIAWKFLGDKKVQVLGLDDFSEYQKDPNNDYALVRKAWELFNEADIVVAHNGVAFDTKKIKARMIIHGMEPHSYIQEVDTLKLARKHFAFTSNKLNDVCEVLGIGAKVSTGGYRLWQDILEKQDPKAWAKMKVYNKHDVELLEQLYLKLRPWSTNHPNLATIADRPEACPKCGDDKKGLVVRGYKYTAVSARVSYKCNACGGYSSGRKIEKPTQTKYVS